CQVVSLPTHHSQCAAQPSMRSREAQKTVPVTADRMATSPVLSCKPPAASESRDAEDSAHSPTTICDGAPKSSPPTMKATRKQLYRHENERAGIHPGPRTIRRYLLFQLRIRASLRAICGMYDEWQENHRCPRSADTLPLRGEQNAAQSALITAPATLYPLSLAHGSPRRTEGGRWYRDRVQYRGKQGARLLPEKSLRCSCPI